jgi:hypothetical protein
MMAYLYLFSIATDTLPISLSLSLCFWHRSYFALTFDVVFLLGGEDMNVICLQKPRRRSIEIQALTYDVNIGF